jgi:hypothetical protein
MVDSKLDGRHLSWCDYTLGDGIGRGAGEISSVSRNALDAKANPSAYVAVKDRCLRVSAAN